MNPNYWFWVDRVYAVLLVALIVGAVGALFNRPGWSFAWALAVALAYMTIVTTLSVLNAPN